jgi:hypothetical protein
MTLGYSSSLYSRAEEDNTIAHTSDIQQLEFRKLGNNGKPEWLNKVKTSKLFQSLANLPEKIHPIRNL